MKYIVIFAALLLAACSDETDKKPEQLSGTPQGSVPAPQQSHGGSDAMLWGLLGYMWGSSTATPRTETRYVPTPAPSSTSAAPSYTAPRTTPPAASSSTPSRSSGSSYSSGSSTRSYSSGSSSYSSGSRSSGSSSYSSGGRR